MTWYVGLDVPQKMTATASSMKSATGFGAGCAHGEGCD